MRRLALLAVLLAVAAAASASAELSQNGDLFVRFDGGISPRALPRDSPAPIGVRVEGTIRTPSRLDPPTLRRITIALNSGGRLDSKGLPTCRQSQIESDGTAEALAACGTALVGTGGLTAQASFPEQPDYLLRAEMLLFNSRAGGRPAILAHVAQGEPARITRTIVIEVHRRAGTFGTVISGEVPAGIAGNGHLKSIFFQLQRNYVSQGRRKSYLSASCATPAEVRVATFPFARVSMAFDDGQTLASTLTRTCRVRK